MADGTPSIRFLPHVELRMQERGISRADVLQAVTRPMRVETARPNSKTGAEREKRIVEIGGRRLRVIVEPAANLILVATAMWIR